jgi:competence protein ComFC
MVSQLLKRALTFAQWLVCPAFCVQCKTILAEDLIFCAICFATIKPVASLTLAITPKTSVRVFAISAYEDPIKSLILAKINTQRLASRQLGHLMWRMLPFDALEFDYIVPVPLHWTRYAYRGFNQAEEIALVIAKKSGKPLLNLLYRNRRTVFQSSLHPEERADNVMNVFSVRKHGNIALEGKKILLVDDLMTTGSTVKAAIRSMRKLKPALIEVVVAARCI